MAGEEDINYSDLAENNFAANNLSIYRKIILDMAKYIYQRKNWTDFIWDYNKIAFTLWEVRHFR